MVVAVVVMVVAVVLMVAVVVVVVVAVPGCRRAQYRLGHGEREIYAAPSA